MRRGTVLDEDREMELFTNEVTQVMRALKQGAHEAGYNTADVAVQVALIHVAGALAIDETLDRCVDKLGDHLRDLRRKSWQ